MKVHIVKGDLVEVISGDEKGRRGTVQRVIRNRWRPPRKGYNSDDVWVVVAGINLVKKHQRPTGNVRTQVGIIEREAPIRISNVMLVTPDANKRTRANYKETSEGEYVRYSRKYDEFLPKPQESS